MIPSETETLAHILTVLHQGGVDTEQFFESCPDGLQPNVALRELVRTLRPARAEDVQTIGLWDLFYFNGTLCRARSWSLCPTQDAVGWIDVQEVSPLLLCGDPPSLVEAQPFRVMGTAFAVYGTSTDNVSVLIDYLWVPPPVRTLRLHIHRLPWHDA